MTPSPLPRYPSSPTFHFLGLYTKSRCHLPSSSTPSFPCFTLLPRELQDQIWQHFLAEPLGSTLFSCHKDLWIVYDSCCGGIAFRDDWLRVECRLPGAEVRPETLEWARRHKVDVQSQDDRIVFGWGFSAHRDVLYVGPGERLNHLEELRAPQGCCQWGIYPSKVKTLAMHEQDVSTHNVLQYLRVFERLRTVYIVVQMPEPLTEAEWLEVGPSCGGAFYWDLERATFTFRSDDQDRREGIRRVTTKGRETVDVNGARYRNILAIAKKLRKRLVREKIDSFEIRPVEVVKRSIPSCYPAAPVVV